MKGLLVIFVVYAAFAHLTDARKTCKRDGNVVGVDTCPSEQETDWSIEYLMRHEVCNMFYQCTHGKPVARYCYGNLWFNLNTWKCDWPHNVDCEDRIVPTPTTSTSSPTTTTTTTPLPTTTTTTTPLPTTTTTTTPLPTTTTTTTPLPTTTTTTTPLPTTTTTTTPLPTTTTTTTPLPTTTSTTTTTAAGIDFLPNGCPVDPHIHWLLPHQNNCNLFYYCVWGLLAERKCPGVLHFNTKLQVCDHQVDAGCTIRG